MVNSSSKGNRSERELRRILEGDEGDYFDDKRFAVMRAPASGAGTTSELPDIFAGNGNVFWAIEAKASSGDPIYIQEEEVEALIHFSEYWGAKPRIGARFNRREWSFFHPDELHHTPSNNVRVKEEDLERGMSIDDLDE